MLFLLIFFEKLIIEKITLFLVKPLEDPKKTTDIILKALKDTGQRGIIDRGWGGLGIRKCLLFGAKLLHFFSLYILNSECLAKLHISW